MAAQSFKKPKTCPRNGSPRGAPFGCCMHVQQIFFSFRACQHMCMKNVRRRASNSTWDVPSVYHLCVHFTDHRATCKPVRKSYRTPISSHLSRPRRRICTWRWPLLLYKTSHVCPQACCVGPAGIVILTCPDVVSTNLKYKSWCSLYGRPLLTS